MPVIVGGTNYYIESVLWQVLVGTGIRQEHTRRRRHSGTSLGEAEETTEENKKQEYALIDSGKRSKLVTEDRANPNVSHDSGSASSCRTDEIETMVYGSNVEKESESPPSPTATKVREEQESENRGAETEKAADDPAEKVLLMTTEQMEQLQSTVLHGVLRRVDPVTADRLHPNNKRKIVR